MTERPLVSHDVGAAVAFYLSVALWLTFELLARRRSRDSSRRIGFPDWSLSLIWFAIAASWGVGYVIAQRRIAAVPGPAWWPLLVGLTLMWAGIALRTWAIVALGAFFKLTVVVREDHKVIDGGPYRWLRHPSYLGVVLTLCGIGVIGGSWLGMLIMFVVPLTAFAVRIHIEERALLRALGDDYAAYSRRTARLFPGLY